MFSVQDELQVTDEQIQDEQIQMSAIDEWMSVIMSLWEAVGKNANAEDQERRLREYARQLSIVPLELLERSVDRAIQNNGKYQTVPTIGAVWDALRQELKKEIMFSEGADMEELINQWCIRKFEKAVVRFG